MPNWTHFLFNLPQNTDILFVIYLTKMKLKRFGYLTVSEVSTVNYIEIDWYLKTPGKVNASLS